MKTKQSCECPKCDGSGRISAFAHIESGACFRCGGSGKIAFRKSTQKPVVDPIVDHAANLRNVYKTLARVVANCGKINPCDKYESFLIDAVRQSLTMVDAVTQAKATEAFEALPGFVL